mmetsp:Transcript_12723/g.23087  ORF Transcript_12723/g.23087 Transcript_12723/m.23087 type:complete len:209 (-) Transcript_12723:126-752(-)
MYRRSASILKLFTALLTAALIRFSTHRAFGFGFILICIIASSQLSPLTSLHMSLSFLGEMRRLVAFAVAVSLIALDTNTSSAGSGLASCLSSTALLSFGLSVAFESGVLSLSLSWFLLLALVGVTKWRRPCPCMPNPTETPTPLLDKGPAGPAATNPGNIIPPVITARVPSGCGGICPGCAGPGRVGGIPDTKPIRRCWCAMRRTAGR